MSRRSRSRACHVDPAHRRLFARLRPLRAACRPGPVRERDRHGEAMGARERRAAVAACRCGPIFPPGSTRSFVARRQRARVSATSRPARSGRRCDVPPAPRTRTRRAAGDLPTAATAAWRCDAAPAPGGPSAQPTARPSWVASRIWSACASAGRTLRRAAPARAARRRGRHRQDAAGVGVLPPGARGGGDRPLRPLGRGCARPLPVVRRGARPLGRRVAFRSSARQGRHAGRSSRACCRSSRSAFPTSHKPPEREPDTERFLLFEAVSSLLAEESAVTPIVLVLDDLHWADKSTLALLKHLARSPYESRLLVVGPYREAQQYRTDHLADTLADLHRQHQLRATSLDGLDEPGVRSLDQRAVGPRGGAASWRTPFTTRPRATRSSSRRCFATCRSRAPSSTATAAGPRTVRSTSSASPRASRRSSASGSAICTSGPARCCRWRRSQAGSSSLQVLERVSDLAERRVARVARRGARRPADRRGARAGRPLQLLARPHPRDALRRPQRRTAGAPAPADRGGDGEPPRRLRRATAVRARPPLPEVRGSRARCRQGDRLRDRRRRARDLAARAQGGRRLLPPRAGDA